MKRGTPDHPKTAALAQALDVHRLTAIGLLEQLWHWTARYAPRGDIGRWPAQTIAQGLYWDGEPEKLERALIDSGWLDEDPEHRLLVHDWAQHADDAVKKSLARHKMDFATVSRRRRDRVRTVSAVEALTVAPAVAVAVPKPQPEPSRALPEPSDPSDHGPRKNPLMTDRQSWEARWHVAVTLLSELQNRDPAEVAAEHSRYPGGRTSKLNPASMTEDRLMQTVLSLEKGLVTEREMRANTGPPDVQAVCAKAPELVREFVAWRRDHPEPPHLGTAFTAWRELRGISFQAAAAAGLLRLADEALRLPA